MNSSKNYIDKLRKQKPEMFIGANKILANDSIMFVSGLKDLEKYLLEGAFSILENYPRRQTNVELIMDFCLTWDGPDYYVAYMRECGYIETLEEFLKNNF